MPPPIIPQPFIPNPAPPADDADGYCRRHAPQALTFTLVGYTISDDHYASWPRVRAEDWCGEYSEEDPDTPIPRPSCYTCKYYDPC